MTDPNVPTAPTGRTEPPTPHYFPTSTAGMHSPGVPAHEPPTYRDFAQPAPSTDPGQVLGILSIVLAFVLTPVVGLILGLIGRHQSRDAGFSGTLSTAGIWISSALLGFAILAIGVFLVVATAGTAVGY